MLSPPCLPVEIGLCGALCKLDLENCRELACLPAQMIGNCANLRTLNLAYCVKLTSLPPELGHCAALQTLDLLGWAVQVDPRLTALGFSA